MTDTQFEETITGFNLDGVKPFDTFESAANGKEYVVYFIPEKHLFILCQDGVPLWGAQCLADNDIHVYVLQEHRNKKHGAYALGIATSYSFDNMGYDLQTVSIHMKNPYAHISYQMAKNAGFEFSEMVGDFMILTLNNNFK